MKRGRAWRGLSLSKGFPPLLFCRDRELGFTSTAVIWEEAASPPKPACFLRSVSQPAANPSDSAGLCFLPRRRQALPGLRYRHPKTHPGGTQHLSGGGPQPTLPVCGLFWGTFWGLDPSQELGVGAVGMQQCGSCSDSAQPQPLAGIPPAPHLDGVHDDPEAAGGKDLRLPERVVIQVAGERWKRKGTVTAGPPRHAVSGDSQEQATRVRAGTPTAL